MSSRDSDRGNLSHSVSAGAYTLAEILSQPQCWSESLKQLENNGKAQEIRELFDGAREWLFLGCGSSYFLGLSAAASWSKLTGTRARAIPASELLLFPDLVQAGSSRFIPVLISRSGRTSEVLKAAEFLKARNIASLAVTCTADQPLEQLATSTLQLLPADEQSTVMTRSFTSMLIGLQYLAANLSGNQEFVEGLRTLPGAAEAALGPLPQRVREFVIDNQFADYVCLGQGPFYGLACESTLKITEMSSSYGQSFHTLEFRHGPKSIVSKETLVIFLLSEANYPAQRDVLEEVKELGGTTLVIANRADHRTRAATDFLLEFSFDLPEFARLAPYVFVGQLMGLYAGLQKGLDPDRPRNLSRVVILGEDEMPERPHHAAF